MLQQTNKRIIGLAAALILIISACGGDSANDATTNAPATTTVTDWTQAPATTTAPRGGRYDSAVTTTAAPTTTGAPSRYGEEDRLPEPDVPYGGTDFENYGVNPARDPVRDRFSTFALDVDTGSYTIGRRFISDGNVPAQDTVRVEEYVNFFDMRYPTPTESTFAIHLDAAPTPYVKGPLWRAVTVGVQGMDVTKGERKPANLTFVIDVSGSMEQGDRIDALKSAMKLLVRKLDARDQVAIVAYNSRAHKILEPTVASETDVITGAIDSLSTGGSTNVEAGLRLGYEFARQSRTNGATNRVVLASDGVANVDATTPERILESARRGRDDGIDLVSVGFGMGNYNDVLLEQLADQGDGFYAYVDNHDEARRLFGENLIGTLEAIAKDAKIQVEFNPAVVEKYRLVGFENRRVADDDFRNDSVDGGEIGAGHHVTAVYEVKLANPAPETGIANATIRWTDPDNGQTYELSEELFGSRIAPTYESAGAAFRLATTVAAYAETLRGSKWAENYAFDEVVWRAERLVDTGFGDDPDVREFAELVRKVARLG